MPTADEILSRMAFAKYFTKLDASNAFWQVLLDDESSRLVFTDTYVCSTLFTLPVKFAKRTSPQ